MCARPRGTFPSVRAPIGGLLPRTPAPFALFPCALAPPVAALVARGALSSRVFWRGLAWGSWRGVAWQGKNPPAHPRGLRPHPHPPPNGGLPGGTIFSGKLRFPKYGVYIFHNNSDYRVHPSRHNTTQRKTKIIAFIGRSCWLVPRHHSRWAHAAPLLRGSGARFTARYRSF